MTINKVVCPACKRVLRNINAYHYCQEVAIDDLFRTKSDDILLAFDKLVQHLSLWEDVEISATKNCIVFVRNKTFLVAKPMTKWLEVKFYSLQFIEDEYLFKCQLWNKKYAGIIRVQQEQELTPVFFNYFKESYFIL